MDQGEPEAPEWGAAPEALSLTVDAEGRLHGRDGFGVPVTIAQGDGQTRVVAHLEPPLGMDLRVVVDEEAPTPGALGFAELEAVFRISAADVEHARRVLGPCVPALLEAARRHPTLEVNDARVSATLPGAVSDPAALAGALQTVAVVARWLRGTRSQELAGWELAIAQAWPTIAGTWGLALDLGGLRMQGAAFGTRFEVWIEPGAQPRTAMRVRVAPLGFHLSLSRAADERLAERFTVGETFETGEPELDAYRVVGRPEEHLRALLDPTNRAALLALLERASAVSFEDDAVELWSPGAVTHGAGLEAMIGDARQAADRLRELPERERSGPGPYRS